MALAVRRKPSDFSDEQRVVAKFVEGRAQKVVQDQLDAAEKLRQDNMAARRAAVAAEQAASAGLSFM